MSLYKIKIVIDNWSECRKRTVTSLRRSASILRSSHKANATAEHESAAVSLVGDLVGLGGVVLAPFSGGLSLALCGVSATTGIGSYLNKRQANNENDRIKREVENDVERAVEQDRRATVNLNELFAKFTYLERQLDIMMVDDILISIQETSITTLDINVREIEGNRLSSQLQQRSAPLSIPGLGISTQVANLNAALTSAEEVVKITRITKEVFRGTKTIRQVVSTAKSVNQISKAANSLSTARQAAALSIQASQTMARSTSAFASVAKGTDGVVKTVGAVSSATKSARIAAEVVTASGQAASAAKTVTKAVKAGTAISTATKGADTTIKTVKNIKQASNTVKTVTQVATDTEKAVRTTRVTTNAARVTRVTETATKAASISKVGLAINAVVIPLDIYNLVVASDNLNKSHEDVQRIEDQANILEQEMKSILEDVNVQIECFSELHLQLCKVYKNHRIAVIYDYLEMMHEKLSFTIPVRY
ncbi:uncharacterized protein LOC123557671 [Mercenaria mercenaria]|uniref:uncharacterized protein LOC123557671 n=1 Tax=Mercenaria mercenaria TaxID=6596 RepID=UPI00234F6F8B|nr:uncharacterized protein LOC123557671 [Mercenaria mercenaria]